MNHKMNEAHMQNNKNRNSVNYSKHSKKLHGYGQFSNYKNIEIYTDTIKAWEDCWKKSNLYIYIYIYIYLYIYIYNLYIYRYFFPL